MCTINAALNVKQSSNGRYYSALGFSLVEVIIFIMILSISITGILSVMNITLRSSADPLINKQALAIAESILEEVQLMPFTWCDPNDASAVTATSYSAGQCTTFENTAAPEAGETRYSTTVPFDNVNDYHNFTMGNTTGSAMQNILGTTLTGLSGYKVTVTTTAAALGVIPSSAAYLIKVTVDGPNNSQVVLEGYRTRYAPNTSQ